MMMKQLMILTFLFVSMMSCNKNKYASISKPSSVEFIQVAKGNSYGDGKEQISKENLVITNNENWEKLIQKMNSVNNVSEYFAETNIDFENYSILAIFDEIKRNGGHTISIKTIAENKNNLVATIERENPNGDATSVITQPFQIVKISKTSKPVLFK